MVDAGEADEIPPLAFRRVQRGIGARNQILERLDAILQGSEARARRDPYAAARRRQANTEDQRAQPLEARDRPPKGPRVSRISNVQAPFESERSASPCSLQDCEVRHSGKLAGASAYCVLE